MKKIRKHLPIALGIIALLALYGLVGEPQAERDATTAYVAETINAAREESLTAQRGDDWQRHVDWFEQFVPQPPQIALK